MNVWWDKVNWKPFVKRRPLGCFSSWFLVSDDYGFRGPRFSHHWSSQQVHRQQDTGIHTSRFSLPLSEVLVICVVLRVCNSFNLKHWFNPRLKRAKFNLYRILLINVRLLLWSIDCQHLSIINVIIRIRKLFSSSLIHPLTKSNLSHLINICKLFLLILDIRILRKSQPCRRLIDVVLNNYTGLFNII